MEIPAFERLVDGAFDYYGVDGNKFKIGDCVYEVIEDRDDGYRSSMSEIVPCEDTGNFSQTPIARVIVCGVDRPYTRLSEDRYDAVDDGFCLIDYGDNTTCWLEFGTCNEDDYYPQFVFHARNK